MEFETSGKKDKGNPTESGLQPQEVPLSEKTLNLQSVTSTLHVLCRNKRRRRRRKGKKERGGKGEAGDEPEVGGRRKGKEGEEEEERKEEETVMPRETRPAQLRKA